MVAVLFVVACFLSAVCLKATGGSIPAPAPQAHSLSSRQEFS